MFGRAQNRVRMGAAALVLPALMVAGLAPAAAAAAPAATPTITDGPNFLGLAAPLTSAQCQQTYGVRCYSPAQFQAAYGLDELYRRGIDGRGSTIVIPVPFGSPTIRADLHIFDQQFHLPDPELTILRFGTIPPYDENDETRIEWAAGTSLAVENAHILAPRARIVLAETAVSEDTGVSGFPELLAAEDALIKAGVGDVILQIEGTSEASFPGYAQGDYSSLLNLRGTYRRAAQHGVTVLAAAGNGGGGMARWPASDPLVTAVGGSRLYLDAAGRRLRPDSAWDDNLGAAGGGGLSAVFARPSYQRGVSAVVGAHRGLPDVSMAASVDGGGWIYTSFGGVGGPGWQLFDSTGQATGLFAGAVAVLRQALGHRLGLLNPALYTLAASSCGHDRSGSGHQGFGRSSGLVDITTGSSALNGSPGFAAAPGYDLATGTGTIDVPALARSLR